MACEVSGISGSLSPEFDPQKLPQLSLPHPTASAQQVCIQLSANPPKRSFRWVRSPTAFRSKIFFSPTASCPAHRTSHSKAALDDILADATKHHCTASLNPSLAFACPAIRKQNVRHTGAPPCPWGRPAATGGDPGDDVKVCFVIFRLLSDDEHGMCPSPLHTVLPKPMAMPLLRSFHTYLPSLHKIGSPVQCNSCCLLPEHPDSLLRPFGLAELHVRGFLARNALVVFRGRRNLQLLRQNQRFLVARLGWLVGQRSLLSPTIW